MVGYGCRLPIAFLLLALGGAAFAQETFQFAGSGGSMVWENPANWTGGSGNFSAWPSQAPEAGTRDSAVVTGTWNSLSLEVADPITLDVLQMGASGFSETVITGAAGATLTANRIEPTGSVFATNRLEIDLLLDGGIEFANAFSAFTLDGRLINGTPTGEQRTVQNDLDRTLSVNGEVVLSDQTGTAGDLRFVNGGSSSTIVAGVISDGPAAGGRITYARGDFEILAANTYTGSTQLGSNDPNVGANHVIHTDQAFGSGRLIISGGNELKVIRGAPGKGTRTLSNEVQIARRVVFAGSESIVLDGQVFQSNGRRVINEIASNKTLTFNGDIYASDSSDVREWVFDGPGQTLVRGVIDESINDSALTGASVAIAGTGRVVFTNPAVAAYTGETRINVGVLQLGEGTDAVGLNGDRVTGDGRLEINHSGTLAFDTVIEGGLEVRHTGSGTTLLSRANTNTGGYVVTNGTLLVDGVVGDVSVGGGVLGGSGTVGAVDVLASGVIAPGDGVGTLNASMADFQPGGRFEIELGATASDLLSVAGLASLDGDLSITLSGGPIDPLDDFVILSATNLMGEFANAPNGGRLATEDGLGSFLITYDTVANRVVLADFLSDTLPGDFNQDGLVDAADYTVWRDAFASTNPNLAADGDGDGDIDQDDYVVWSNNYGSSLTPSTASSAVPEPGAASVAAFAAALLLAIRPRVGRFV